MVVKGRRGHRAGSGQQGGKGEGEGGVRTHWVTVGTVGTVGTIVMYSSFGWRVSVRRRALTSRPFAASQPQKGFKSRGMPRQKLVYRILCATLGKSLNEAWCVYLFIQHTTIW